MSKPSREEELETKGYLLGIAEGLSRAAGHVNNLSGEHYKARRDDNARLLRELSGELHGMYSKARELYDKEYPKEQK